MRTFLAIIYCFMNLAGCTGAQNRSIVVTSHENGAVTLDSRTDVRMGRAWFECTASQSGRCFYTVFDGDRAVREFSLPVAGVLRVESLPAGFGQCVRAAAGRVSADCKAG